MQDNTAEELQKGCWGLSAGAEQEAEASVKQVNEKLKRRCRKLQGAVRHLRRYAADFLSSLEILEDFAMQHRGGRDFVNRRQESRFVFGVSSLGFGVSAVELGFVIRFRVPKSTPGVQAVVRCRSTTEKPKNPLSQTWTTVQPKPNHKYS